MSSQFEKNVRYLALTTATILGFFSAMACGGGGSSSVTPDVPATPVPVAISGTVSIPASASISANKTIQKVITGAAGAGLTVACSTLDGISLGSSTSAADGTFTIDADLNALKPAGTTGTWSADLICSAKSADGKTDLQLFYTATFTEGASTDVAVGTIDVTSTIAAAELKKDMGCEDEGSKCTKTEGLDYQCLALSSQGFWSQTSDTATSNDFAWLAGMLRKLNEELFAVGFDWSALECKTAGKCISQGMDCTLSDSDLAAMYSAAATIDSRLSSDPKDFDSNKTGWLGACAATKGVHDALTSLAVSADAATVCAKLTIDGGADHARIITQALLATPSDAASDTTFDMGSFFNATAWHIIDASAVDGVGALIINFLATEMDDSADRTLDDSPIILDFLSKAAAAAAASGLDASHLGNYGAGCSRAFRATGASTVCPNGTCDPFAIGFVTAPFTQDNFNPNNYNYDDSKMIFGMIPNMKENDRAVVTACYEMANATARNTCYVQNFPGGNNNDSNDGNNNEGQAQSPDTFYDGLYTTTGCFGGSVTISSGAAPDVTFTSHVPCAAHDGANQSIACSFLMGALTPTSISLFFPGGACTLTAVTAPPYTYWDGTWRHVFVPDVLVAGAPYCNTTVEFPIAGSTFDNKGHATIPAGWNTTLLGSGDATFSIPSGFYQSGYGAGSGAVFTLQGYGGQYGFEFARASFGSVTTVEAGSIIELYLGGDMGGMGMGSPCAIHLVKQ